MFLGGALSAQEVAQALAVGCRVGLSSGFVCDNAGAGVVAAVHGFQPEVEGSFKDVEGVFVDHDVVVVRGVRDGVTLAVGHQDADLWGAGRAAGLAAGFSLFSLPGSWWCHQGLLCLLFGSVCRLSRHDVWCC